MNQWTLRYADGISLLDADGQPVPLAYRKVGELLLALLKAPDRTCPREELGARLWPGSSAAVRATNLRQAIKKLRDAIGARHVTSDRFECGIAPSFSCSIAEQIVNEPIPGWLNGWSLFLEELSYSSPVQFFEACRANVDLLCDLPMPRLAVLVNRASAGLAAGHPLDGWREFVLGSVSFRDVPIAGRHFRDAAKHASKTTDSDLLSRSVFWTCACQILRGQVDQAERLASEGLAHGRSCRTLLSTARATALLHSGRFSESRKLMADASEVGAKTVFEHEQQEALRAYYLATTGYEGEAMRLVETIRKSTSYHAGGRVGVLTGLACAAIETAESPALAVEKIETQLPILRASGQHHFVLYATETLVSALARCNRTSEARAKFAESRRNRNGLGIAYSAWDKRRLDPFIVA